MQCHARVRTLPACNPGGHPTSWIQPGHSVSPIRPPGWPFAVANLQWPLHGRPISPQKSAEIFRNRSRHPVVMHCWCRRSSTVARYGAAGVSASERVIFWLFSTVSLVRGSGRRRNQAETLQMAYPGSKHPREARQVFKLGSLGLSPEWPCFTET